VETLTVAQFGKLRNIYLFEHITPMLTNSILSQKKRLIDFLPLGDTLLRRGVTLVFLQLFGKAKQFTDN